MSTLNRAIEITNKAHEGATDKYGAPSINELKIDEINSNITS